MSNLPSVEMRAVSKSYAANRVLKDVSLTCHQGTAHALLGGNGAGKSTLMKILAGLVQHDSGSITINGTPADKLDPQKAQQLGIYLVPQEAQIFPNQTVLNNILIGSPHKLSRQIVSNLCKELDISLDLDALGATLEIANRQVIEILRGLIRQANILILDEPTSALTPREAEALFKQIRKLKAQGVCIIFISHKLPEIREICEEISVLRDGIIALHGSMDDIKDEHIIDAMRKADTDTSSNMTDTPSTAQHNTAQANHHDHPILQLSNVSGEGFHNISLSIHHGEIVALAGMVGSGRSELAESLFGIRPINQGSIYIDGKEITLPTPSTAIQHGLVYLPEDRQLNGLFLDAALDWNISAYVLPTMHHLTYHRDERQLFHFFRSTLSIKCEQASQSVGELSGGNQQKILLAKCLATKPKILILDEPTRGVDINARHDIYQMIRKLAADGIGILLISSDFEEISLLADRVTTMIHSKQGPTLEQPPYSSRQIAQAAFGIQQEEKIL